MIKQYVGRGAFLVVSLLCLSICAEPSTAELRKMVAEQVVAEKEKIEDLFSQRRQDLIEKSTFFCAGAAACVLGALESTVKLVKGDITGIDTARVTIGGIPAVLCSVMGLKSLWQLRALSAEKALVLEQLDDQKRELLREISKKERQMRAEQVAKETANKTRQPANTPVDSDAEPENDSEDASALVAEITAAAESDTKS